MDLGDLEKQPVLQDHQAGKDEEYAKYATMKSMGTIHSIARRTVYRDPVRDSMTYHTQELGSWSSLIHLSFTVWRRRSLWATAAKLLMASVVVALVVLVSVRDPAALKVSQFNHISNFLRVFVGLLLGFFMSASVNRWWACVDGFLQLCGALRKLQMIMHSCNMPEDDVAQCVRYGFMSARLLHMELHVAAMPDEEQDMRRARAWEAVLHGGGFKWETISIDNGSLGFQSDVAYLTPEEATMLQRTADPAGVLWAWIGTVLGKMAQCGTLGPLAPPTFARCMMLAGEGLDKILRVRSSISVQAPYIYVQMLASLVHINNLVCAISFGLTSGSTIATILVRYNIHWFSSKTATPSQATQDIQSFMVSFFFSCFGPFIYQALLETSIAIAQPFSNDDAVVPTTTILLALEKDLADGARTAALILEPLVRNLSKRSTKPSPRDIHHNDDDGAASSGSGSGDSGDADGDD